MSINHRTGTIIIGKNVASTATNLATMVEGEVSVIKPDNTFLAPGDTVSDAEYIYIVVKTADGYKYSNKIQGRNITKFEGADWVAATQQVSFVGYDGTTGVLNVEDETEYSLHIVFKHNKDIWSQRQHKKTFHYTTGIGATAAEIVDAFVDLINNDEETSSLVVAANVGPDLGISITGLVQPYNTLDEFEQVQFELALDGGFGGSSETTLFEFGAGNSVNRENGSGTYELVRDIENDMQGYEGITNRVGFPVPDFPFYAEAANEYDVYSIQHDDVHGSSSLNRDIASPMVDIIAVPRASGITPAPSLQSVLEARLFDYMADLGVGITSIV
jgi:hypothetical protein